MIRQQITDLTPNTGTPFVVWWARNTTGRLLDRLPLVRTYRRRMRLANRLAWHLDSLNEHLYENRYGQDGPCPGCFDAVIGWEEETGWRRKR